MADQKPNVNSYCKAAIKLGEPNLSYHNKEYGFPAKNDDELFRRLMLEVNQAGLSWTTILNKKEGMIAAYDGFIITKVAAYKEKDRKRLLADPSIIRNKLKVNAAIYNAGRILEMQKEFGSFKKWLDQNAPLTREEWVKLFRKNFKFTGGEITNEFLMSTGYLEGAHHETCPIYAKVLKKKPNWAKESRK